MPIREVRPIHHFDEVLFDTLNGEVFECYECQGGQIYYDDEYNPPGTSEWCCQCEGSGYLGMLTYTPRPILRGDRKLVSLNRDDSGLLSQSLPIDYDSF